MEGEKKYLYEQAPKISPEKNDDAGKNIETEQPGPMEELADDPRFRSIKDELIASWEKQNGNRWNGNELRSEFQDYLFGDPTAFKRHEKPVTLDDRAEYLFRERFSESVQIYDEQEKKRIYDNLIDDPLFKIWKMK